MDKKLQSLKNKLGINNIFPISDINGEKGKIYLFHNNIDMISYSLCTDGTLTHIDTWIDKKPGGTDSFLDGCSTSKKFEFRLNNASIALLEKTRGNSVVRNLYINEQELLKAITRSMYKVEITENEKIMIKKMEDSFWK